MSYLDDNRQRIHEEIYLEMGRRLANAQDEMPVIYRVVFFTLDVEEGHPNIFFVTLVPAKKDTAGFS